MDSPEDTRNRHPRIRDYYDEDYYGYIRVTDFENSPWTEFARFDFIDDEKFDELLEDVLDDTSPVVAEIISGYRRFMELKYGKDALSPAILKVINLPEGILSHKDAIEPELLSTFISDLVQLDPFQFTLNADSILYSDAAYSLFMNEIFPHGNVPKHLLPLFYVSTSENADRIPDCRLVATTKRIQNCVKGFDRSFDFVIPNNLVLGAPQLHTLRDVKTLLFVSAGAHGIVKSST